MHCFVGNTPPGDIPHGGRHQRYTCTTGDEVLALMKDRYVGHVL